MADVAPNRRTESERNQGDVVRRFLLAPTVAKHGSTTVRHIDPSGFFRLGFVLAQLADSEPRVQMDPWMIEAGAMLVTHLQQFREEWLLPHDLSTEACDELIGIVGEFARETRRGFPLGHYGDQVHYACVRFNNELMKQLQGLSIYDAFPKRGYPARILLEQPTHLLSPIGRALLARHPDRVENWREMGRCLAFAAPTAAAFHLLRVCEAVIREYARLVSAEAITEPLILGRAIAALRRSNVDPHVAAALDSLRTAHRNETMHPGPAITEDDALTLLFSCIAVLDRIGADLKERGALQAEP